MSWSDDKKLSSGADVIGWNSLSKKKNDKELEKDLFVTIVNEKALTYFITLH